LRDTVKELRSYLHKNSDWPMLQKRFSAIENSLALMQGRHPGELNSEALRALPETTASLQLLMKEVSSDCNPDASGHVTELIDHVYNAIEDQNQEMRNLERKRIDWSMQIDEISRWYSSCAENIDSASVAIANAENNVATWLQEAVARLRAAKDDIRGLLNISPSGLAPKAAGVETMSAGKTLDQLLDATLKSLAPAATAQLVSHLGADTPSQILSKPNSISLTKSDPTLINKVREIVENPRYFSPKGSTTQIVDCIAVCWTVWVVYSSDSAYDVDQRRSLIASALYFRLIWGTVAEAHEELANQLQKVYWLTLQSTA
jgi:hypothetical protein